MVVRVGKVNSNLEFDEFISFRYTSSYLSFEMSLLSTSSTNESIFKNGWCLAKLSASTSDIAEEWCEKLNKNDSNVKFDWHYQQGTAMLLYVGDHAQAKSILTRHTDIYYDDLYGPNTRSMGQLWDK